MSDLCKSFVCWLMSHLVVKCCVIVSVNKFYDVIRTWTVRCIVLVQSFKYFCVLSLRGSQSHVVLMLCYTNSECFQLLSQFLFMKIWVEFGCEKCAFIAQRTVVIFNTYCHPCLRCWCYGATACLVNYLLWCLIQILETVKFKWACLPYTCFANGMRNSHLSVSHVWPTLLSSVLTTSFLDNWIIIFY